ncbi:MAG: glutamate--tRNA ligase [Spirochaetia bacterium]|nr:glutamate--tRNA ligase [Spirochaetia bacterium]
MEVRVRYAPSPTGLQHIGGVRTALFNYFFARANGGKFLLRIEDTDRERYSDESLEDLYSTLEWLGIKWDEGPIVGGSCGPYVQSERTELYREYARKLVETGHAYYCYCTSERLEQLREKQKVEKKEFGYDRKCRDLSEEEQQKLRDQGIRPVIRLKIPLDGYTEYEDFLLGKMKKKNTDVNPDPILLKSDGFPTYHLANVIDDHFMGITHILRAQEWIPSIPLHVILYKAFGWEPPVYCHLPMVMGSDGQKLSKRHGSTSVRDFRAKGYLPEAILNYVSLIGWSYDDSREFFTREELERLFTLDKLNKAPGVFDYKKLDWFNGQYIRKKSDDELMALLIPYLEKAGTVSTPMTEAETAVLKAAVPLAKERLKYLSDIPEVIGFLFKAPENYCREDLIPKKLDQTKTLEILDVLSGMLDKFITMSEEEIEPVLRDKCAELGVKLGDFLMVLRVAVTGTRISPPIVGSIKLLGAEETERRIKNTINLLKSGDK